MTGKLTLSLDKSVVEKAKKYATQRNVSLSKLVEFFFSSLTTDAKGKNVAISPITAALSGMVASKKICEKDVLAQALIEKHL
ncbi:MAG: DUF6364 family protein [Candidatus Omnitrophica bacterium]|nr:DUF6364 family protein [Candidatus Omnitrophota bacterium]